MRHHSPSTRRSGAAVVALRSGPTAGPVAARLVGTVAGSASCGSASGGAEQPARRAAATRTSGRRAGRAVRLEVTGLVDRVSVIGSRPDDDGLGDAVAD